MIHILAVFLKMMSNLVFNKASYQKKKCFLVTVSHNKCISNYKGFFNCYTILYLTYYSKFSINPDGILVDHNVYLKNYIFLNHLNFLS